MTQKPHFLSLFVSALALSSCMTVPNTTTCTAAGTMSAGLICAETLTDKTRELTFEEMIDMLEPQDARECVPLEGLSVCASSPDPASASVKLPARGGAIVQSAEDWNKNKTALEEACRLLGGQCSYEVQKAIGRMEAAAQAKESK